MVQLEIFNRWQQHFVFTYGYGCRINYPDFSGAEMLYVAMFDEIDEGTTIFKGSDTPPNGKATQFVGNDGCLPITMFLSGKAEQMLRKEIPLS